MALITKLDVSVTDENLPKLGCYRIYARLKNGSICSAGINNTNFVSHVEFVGEGSLCDSSGNDIPAYDTNASSYTIYFKSTGGYVQVSNKYSVTSVIVAEGQRANVNLDDFAYSSNLNYFSSSYAGSFGDISSLKGFLNTATVSIHETSSANITGNLDSLASKKFSSLSLRYLSKLTGDLSAMSLEVAGSYTSIELLGLTNTTVTAEQMGKFVNATKIVNNRSGIVYSDIADALYANGKVSGTVSITDASLVARTCTFTSSGWTTAN